MKTFTDVLRKTVFVCLRFDWLRDLMALAEKLLPQTAVFTSLC